MPFTFQPLEIPDVIRIVPRLFGDERGFFLEWYQSRVFEAAGICDTFVQDNHSRSTRGVLRGLHFQRPPHAQAKLLRCLAGEIYDVAVDIRPASPTFGRWVGLTLTPPEILYIPVGFAHGFVVVSEVADVLYKTSADYAPEFESGIAWNDPALAIPWPVAAPQLSERDRHWPPLRSPPSVAPPRD